MKKKYKIPVSRVIEVILFFFGMAMCILIFYIFTSWNYFLLQDLFGDFFRPGAIFPVSMSISFASAWTLFFLFSGIEYLKRKVNKWFLLAICLMIFALGTGFGFLYDFLGRSSLSSVLRDRNNKIVGTLKCVDNTGMFLAGSLVTCVPEPNLCNFTANITFTFLNGSSFTETHENEISFIAPYRVRRIYFSLSGYDENGTLREMSVGRDFSFLSEEENRERKDKLIAYLIGLFGVVLISIPNMMLNLKRLWEY